MSTPIETERKFLIRMPDVSMLSSLDGVRVMDMEQTYLECESGKNSRVRKITSDGRVSYVKTTKQRISTLSCYEEEESISSLQYEEELKKADKTKSTVIKTRYAFPFADHTVEIDVYPFWSDRAILEIELASESESIVLPDFIQLIKEVSEDSRYKNTNIAIAVPNDAI